MMEESMFRFLIDEVDETGKKKVMSTACIYALMSTTVWCGIGYTVLRIIGYEYATVFILYMISSILMKLANGTSRGLSKIKIYSLSNVILSILTIGLNILFIAVFKWGVYGLLYSTVIANVLTCLFVLLKLRVYHYVKPQYFDKKKLKVMIKYSFPLVPNNISWYIINISDRIVVTGILGSSVNGIYAMANKFPNIMNNFSSFFFTAFKENVAIAVKKDDYEKYYNEIYVIVHNAFIAISLLIISILPFIFNIFIKKDYVAAYEYIPLLVIALYYGNMAGFYGTLFTAFKESKIIGKSTVCGAIVNLVVHLGLIYFIGIYAAIISTLVSNYAVAIYRKTKLKGYVELKPLKNYYLAILMLVLVAGLYYLRNTYVNILSLLLVLVYVFITNKDLINDVKKMIFKRRKKA
jgi:O-antigen/teichoic acid export membrane protein